MKRIDARKLSTETQQKIRYVAIELRKQNKTYVEISEILGVSFVAVHKWWIKYKAEGYNGLKIKTRGVKIGTNRRLDEQQILILRKILINKTPDQLGLAFSLWTRQAIQNLVLKLWSIFMPLRTITDYMKRLGFTLQKPIKRAYEQNSKTINKWLENDYPKINQRATKEKAEIHWVDETGLSSYSNYLRGYSPIGKTPLIRMKAKRMNINIISSVSKLGTMRFMTYKEALNTKTFIKFVNRLSKDASKKIFIILDNLAVHHSKIFKIWLEKRKDKIMVFYLPPYSPELNPDERLNRDLKTHFHSGTAVKNEQEFKKKVTSYLKSMQKRPKRVMNYFNSKFVRYAA